MICASSEGWVPGERSAASGWSWAEECLMMPSRVSKGQVEPVVVRVALFELVHHPEALAVVLEPAVVFQQLVQLALARVAEGRVPEVVGQGDALRQVLVQAQGPRDAPRYLRHTRWCG